LRLENVEFVLVSEVERIHEEALLKGGAKGVLDPNLLISAIEMPRTTFDGMPLYPSFAEIAATYAWGLARNHPFVDGNKRTALLTALTFLAVNGRPIRVGPEWVDIMVRVASDDSFTRMDLVEAFRNELGSDEAVT
jgi:death-on-curing protein